MNEEQDFNEQWQEIEKQLRLGFEENFQMQKETFEKNLQKLKATFFRKAEGKEKQKKLPIVPVTLVYYTPDGVIPLAIHEFAVLGELTEIANIIDLSMKEFLKSKRYRDLQNKTFAELKDKYGLKDREIFPLLDSKYKDWDAQTKTNFRKRLEASYRRTNTKKRLLNK
jgi:hypothetical protein